MNRLTIGPGDEGKLGVSSSRNDKQVKQNKLPWLNKWRVIWPKSRKERLGHILKESVLRTCQLFYRQRLLGSTLLLVLLSRLLRPYRVWVLVFKTDRDRSVDHLRMHWKPPL